MHGPRPTDRPAGRLRLRGGAIRQRLIAAAWPGLAELALEAPLVWPALPATRRARPLPVTTLPAARPR